MGNSPSDNAVVFHDQEVRYRGIGESLLLSVSAGIWIGRAREINTAAVIPAVPAPLLVKNQHQSQLNAHGTHRMATLVFWHVPLRFCNGEALANPRARQAQKTFRTLTCMAESSVDLEVLQAAGSFEAPKCYVPLAIPLILDVPDAGYCNNHNANCNQAYQAKLQCSSTAIMQSGPGSTDMAA